MTLSKDVERRGVSLVLRQYRYINWWLGRLRLPWRDVVQLDDFAAWQLCIRKRAKLLLSLHHPDVSLRSKTMFRQELHAYEQLQKVSKRGWIAWRRRKGGDRIADQELPWAYTRPPVPLPDGYHETQDRLWYQG